MTVYIDLLFSINLIINYLLLLLSSKAVKLHPKRRRILLGALLGAFGAFSIFLPTPNSQALASALDIVYKITLCVLMTACTHGMRQKRVFVRALCSFVLISFACAGVTLSLILTLKPAGATATMNSIYINISPLNLIICVTASYLILKLIERLSSRIKVTNDTYQIKVTYDNNIINCKGLLDTGSSLKDIYNGDPVIVLSPDLLPDNIENLRGYRCIPFQSLGASNGILPAFRPEKCEIEAGGKTITYTNITIAKAQKPFDNGYSAILPTDITAKF